MTCAWRGSCCRAGNSWRHTTPSSAPHGSVRNCSHFRLMVPGAFDPHVSLDVWPPPRSTHPPPQTSCGSRLYSLQSDGHSAPRLAPSLPPDAPFFNLLASVQGITWWLSLLPVPIGGACDDCAHGNVGIARWLAAGLLPACSEGTLCRI